MPFIIGILTNRWRVLFTPIDADDRKASCIVKACCALHNMLCTLNDHAYIPNGYVDQNLANGEIAPGFWRINSDQLHGMQAIPRGHALAATNTRSRFARWCSEEGAVEWQDHHINRV